MELSGCIICRDGIEGLAQLIINNAMHSPIGARKIEQNMLKLQLSVHLRQVQLNGCN